MNRQKRRGDDAERELVGYLRDLTGWPVERALGLGRHTDCGDLDGLPDTCAQVKWYTDPTRAMREILAELPRQWANSGHTFAAGFIRRPGGRWAVIMDVPMFVTLLREATGEPDSDPLRGLPAALHTDQLPFPR